VAGFLDVILRGLILAAQAVAVGGVCFLLLVLRPFGSRPVPDLVTRARSLGLIALGALVLAIGQTLALASELYVLLHDAVWPLMAAVQTLYVQVSLVRILAGVALAACALQLRREPEERRGLWAAIGLLAATIVAAAPVSSSPQVSLSGARVRPEVRRPEGGSQSGVSLNCSEKT